MRRLASIVKKEFLILIRDRAGLGMLFVMPMVLVLVVTLIQDSAFRAVRESEIKLMYLDNDRGTFGALLENGLHEADNFSLITDIEGAKVDENILREKIAAGVFQAGIIVPEGASESIREHARALVAKAVAAGKGPERILTDDHTQPVEVEMYLDPAIRKSFRNSIASTLNYFVAHIEKTSILNILSRGGMEQGADAGRGEAVRDPGSFVTIKEIYAVPEGSRIAPNAVQQNVPAWTMFAIFFIGIPLAGKVIKERDDGISFRLRTMPGAYVMQGLGKIIVYLFVSVIQFVLMLCVGLFVLPMLGTEALMMGSNYPSMALIVVCAGLAATGFGVMLGTLASTHEQASAFGAISVVIAAALGGVMVPVFVMPEVMQKVSVISPLSWGLKGFLDIFLREGDLRMVMPHAVKLLLFFALTLAVTGLRSRRV
jgi:ABC-2 type transport system permease protein